MNRPSRLRPIRGVTPVAALMLLASLVAGAAHAVLVPATSGISYSGRWLTVGTERHAASAGQRFRFQTTATSCSLSLVSSTNTVINPHVAIRVDGGAWVRHTPTTDPVGTISVYQNLPTGTHTVEGVVTSLSFGTPYTSTGGRFILSGVDVPDGAEVRPLPYPSRRVLLVGDSISCGYELMTSTEGASVADRMDARRGPGALLADWSGQDVLVVAAPGMGYTKEANNMPGATAEAFLRNITYDTAWSQPEVEAVFVNLGTNDYNTTTAPDDLLRQKAASFLATTRAMFPKAEIYVLRPFAGVRVNVLQGVVTASGDRRIHWVDTTGWLNLATGADTSDGLHPNASGAQKYAARLMTVLDQTLVLPGDVDNDGQVTLSDAATVAGIAAGTR